MASDPITPADVTAFRVQALSDTPALSPEQKQQMREASLAGWDAAEELRQGSLHDRAERRSAFAADLERAAGSGPSVDPAALALAEGHGLAIDLAPDQYRVSWAEPHRMTPEGATEAKTWASGMKFSASMGAAVLEHLSRVGAAFERMSAAEREQWAEAQRAALVKHAGGEQQADAIALRAREALTLAGTDNKLPKAIAAAGAFQDWWLQSTLSRHLDAYQAFNKRSR
jgi:hypothetical protein